MPGKTKKKVTTEYLEDNDVPQDGAGYQIGEFDEDRETLRSIVEGLGSGDRLIKVYRWTPRGSEYCFKDVVIDEEQIQERYPEGGRFSCRIFLNDTYRQTVNVAIAPRPLNMPGGSGGGNNLTGNELQYRLLQDQLSFLKDLILKQAVNSGGGAPVGELAQAVQVLHGLQTQTQTPSDKIIEAIFKGIELARELSGNGDRDWKQTLLDVVKDSLPLLSTAFAKPNVNGGGGEAAGQLGEQPEALLRRGIAYLKRKALAGADPALWIDFVLGNADEEQFQTLLRAVVSQEYAAFAAVDPEIGREPYVAWFKQLYDGLRSALNEPGPVDTDTGGTDGNAGNSAADGGTGKTGSKRGRKSA